MKQFIKQILFLSFLTSILLACGSENSLNQTDTFSSQITFGQNTTTALNPWQVSLRVNSFFFGSQHICGGSIIGKRVVLTADHCLSDNLQIFAGGPGSGSLSQLSPLPSVARIIRHPKRSERGDTNHDIALLVLSDDIDFEANQNLQIINLLSEDEDINDLLFDNPDELYATGWGRDENGSSPNILQEAILSFVDDDELEEIFAKVEEEFLAENGGVPFDEVEPTEAQLLFEKNFAEGIETKTLIGVHHLNERTNVCQGDSGGPLTIVGSDGERKLIGIASFIFGKCGRLGYYVNPNNHIEWIKEELGDLIDL